MTARTRRTEGNALASPHETRDSRARVFRQVRQIRSLDDVVEQVKEAVAAGELRPGDRLPSERGLCDVFGISRPTLREALRALEALGVITIRRGSAGGIFIARPSADLVSSALESLLRFRGASATDLTEVRLAIEGQNARWAALRAEPQDFKHLDGLVASLTELCERASTPWAEIAAKDIEFHEAVARAAHNTVRLAIMFGINGVLRPLVIEAGRNSSFEERASVAVDHAAIADAIRYGDSEKAELLMCDHIERWGRIEADRELKLGAR